jgi:hypothetical protein
MVGEEVRPVRVVIVTALIGLRIGAVLTTITRLSKRISQNPV